MERVVDSASQWSVVHVQTTEMANRNDSATPPTSIMADEHDRSDMNQLHPHLRTVPMKAAHELDIDSFTTTTLAF